jgi:hypothetical protein
VPEGAPVTLRFRTLHSSGIWGVTARAYLFDTGSGTTTGPVDTGMPFDQNITINGTEYDVWKTTLTMPSAPTVYYYKFKNNRDMTNGWYSGDYLDDNDNVHKDGTGVASDGEPFPSFQFTVYDPNFQTPAWLQRATDSYLHIDPALGGDAALSSLSTELNRRKMQVILDGVFNHASSDGLYFDRYNRLGGTPPNIGACLSVQSQWRTCFNFTDNNVPCSSADYIGWFGLDSLPTWNHGLDAVEDFFYRAPGNVTQYWYSQGASGWRFDVADDGNFPHSSWVDYRTHAKTYNGNGPLIGEVWPNASQWLAGDQMDAVMNYRFRKNVTGFVRNAEWRGIGKYRRTRDAECNSWAFQAHFQTLNHDPFDSHRLRDWII